MRKTIIDLLTNIIRFLKSIRDKINNKNNIISATTFIPLTPLNNIENKTIYFNAIHEALLNNDVKNIAITGIYGSGKSSVIRTFENENIEYQFLYVSLASFKDKEITEDKIDELNRVIELSILQQIFYKEKSSNIPDSRFKRINSLNIFLLMLYSISCLIFLFLGGFVFDIQFIKKAVPMDIKNFIKLKTSFIPLESLIFILFFGAVIFLTIKMIRIINNSKLNKLNVQSGEIEIGDDIDHSILNKHLDEILYFFEVTNYDVVVIEDLDRFGDTEIFTKLRELNNLINNSNQISRKITFIYAIKDDMFKDKDRAKFFDFIIPIIPIINPSNSSELFLKSFNDLKSEDKPSIEFIEDIGIFIDDMRMLKNIFNEYLIYKSNIEIKLQDSLLAIIIYKNIFPGDFAELHIGESILNKLFRDLRQISLLKIQELEKKKKEELKRVEDSKKEELNKIIDLRKIYIQSLNNINQLIFQVTIGGNKIYVSDLINDDNFALFQLTPISSFKYVTTEGHISTNSKVIQFYELEQIVDKEITYIQRENRIKIKTPIFQDDIFKSIAKIEKDIEELRNLKTTDILKKFPSSDFYKNPILIDIKSNQKKLIYFLLSNGYINENYYDYISYFHGESLTKQDNEFLLNLKSGIKNEYTFKLVKICNLFNRLKINDFYNTNILNYDLLDYFYFNFDEDLLKGNYFNNSEFSNEKNYDKFYALIETIVNDMQGKIKDEDLYYRLGNNYEFINGYIERNTYYNEFFETLNIKIPNFWSIICKDGELEKESIHDNFLKLIVINIGYQYDEHKETTVINREKLKMIEDQSKISSYIQKRSNILDLFQTEIECNIIEDVLNIINVKFENIDNPYSNPLLFEYIYKNNHYKINEEMIAKILVYNDFLNEDVKTKNYTTILKSNIESLIKYINDNLKDYVENVFLKLENNIEEEEKSILQLLNSEKISDLFEEIIKKIAIKISDISEIKEHTTDEILFKYNKVKAIWDNVINYFEYTKNEDNDNVFDEIIVRFINNYENAVELSKTELTYKNDTGKINEKLLFGILLNDDINIESYKYIIKSIKYSTKELVGIDSVSLDKILHLITNGIIELSPFHYNFLKEKYPQEHISFLVKKYIKGMSLNGYKFDEDDFVEILKLTSINMEIKVGLINYYIEDLVAVQNMKIVELLNSQIMNLPKLNFLPEFLKQLIEHNTNQEKVILVLLKYSEELEVVDFKELFSKMEQPFFLLSHQGKTVKLELNSINNELAKLLKDIGYVSSIKEENNKLKVKIKRNI